MISNIFPNSHSLSVKHVSSKNAALFTFVASILLSAIAHTGSTLNRDGMLYVRAARAFLDGGIDAARALFNWPFLPILMAFVSRITGLDPETSAHVLNSIFMAGACALMVACIAKQTPENGWLAALVVLAIPGLNEYRNELLREYGCWFFIMLSFWIALNWENRPNWLVAFVSQIALGFAALFRSEALAMFPALLAWQYFRSPKEERLHRLTSFSLLPAIVFITLLVLYLSGQLPESNRIASDIGRLSIDRFNAKAAILASALLDYENVQPRTILFFGSLALVPIKLAQKFGVFLIPILCVFATQPWRAALSRFPLFTLGIVSHLLVLFAFVIDLQFLAGRYVGLILLLSTPFVTNGLKWLMTSHPKWRTIFIAITVIMALSNVVSFGQGKTHHSEAGKWLAANTSESAEIYIDSGRTAYFANWENVRLAPRNDRQAIKEAVAGKKYDLYVLEVSRKDPPIDDWLANNGLNVKQRFGIVSKDSLIIAEPNDKSLLRAKK